MAGLLTTLRGDLDAVHRNDPAAHNRLETALCHTPLHALVLHRVAHVLHARWRVPLLPRLLQVLGRFWSGVEIHPGARIGQGLFIDHGTAVVIGETAEIGDDCVLFHNVTLGGTGRYAGKRHPSLGNNVYVGTGAILLGPIRVGDNSRVGANSFIIMRDVPPDCTVVGVPARIVKERSERVDKELPATRPPEAAIPMAISNHTREATS